MTIQRMQALGWLALGIASVFLALRALYFDPEVAFLTSGEEPAWIAAPLPSTANLIAQDPDDPPESVFVRTFTHNERGTEATLHVRALREVRIRLNDRPLALPEVSPNWRTGFNLDLEPHLHPGLNRLEIGVKRADGPALLQARLIRENDEIQTDSAWQVSSANHPSTPAWRARDQGLHPESRSMPSPSQIAARKAPWLLGLFLLSAVAAILCKRRKGIARNAPRITLAAITLLWITFFFLKVGNLPVDVGFDATAHLAYIDYLRERLQLPSAAYGFATYHPPPSTSWPRFRAIQGNGSWARPPNPSLST